jgi:uncharacterized protein
MVVDRKQNVIDLFKTAKTIAVVGLSSNPMRSSFGVAEYMQSRGYTIIPVNPNEIDVLGVPAVQKLSDVGQPVDIVNIFRRSEFVPEIVDEAIAIGARCVWMQQGVSHPEAAQKAEQAGLLVIMDDCIMRQYWHLMR